MELLENEFHKWNLSENLTTGSIRNLDSFYKEFSKFCTNREIDITRVNSMVAREYMAWLAERPNQHNGKPLSMGTRAKKYDYLKRFGVFLAERNLLQDRSLVEGLRRPIPRYKAIQGFSAQQVQLILETVRTTRSTPKYQDRLVLLIYTLVCTGVRISEALQLTPAIIDHNRRIMVVVGKGNKEREIPLSFDLLNALTEFVEKYKIDRKSFIFASRYGKPLSAASIRDVLRRIRKSLDSELDIDRMRVSPHTFRHTFARLWVVKGGNTIALSRILGHSSTQMTDNYVRLWGIDLNQSYDQCNPCEGIKIT